MKVGVVENQYAKCTTLTPRTSVRDRMEDNINACLYGPSGHYVGPHGAQVPVMSPNDLPNPSQGQQKGFGETRIFEIFQAKIASLKTAKSSPARAHSEGGIPGVQTRDLRHWLGAPCTRK